MNKRIYWKKVKQRGPLLWSSVDEPARSAGLLYERDMESGELTTKVVGHMLIYKCRNKETTMAVNELQVWAECNDGHTTLAGLNADEFTIGDICKWAGVIQLTNVRVKSKE